MRSIARAQNSQSALGKDGYFADPGEGALVGDAALGKLASERKGAELDNLCKLPSRNVATGQRKWGRLTLEGVGFAREQMVWGV